MELLAAWPEWLVWCTVSAAGVVAVALVVDVVDACLDPEGP